MRKLLILGILICVFLAAISHPTLNHQNLSEIKLTEILTDTALYLVIAVSYIFSKNKNLQVIIIIFAIPVDLMSYASLTHGYLIYLSYSIAYLLAGITILAMFPQYKWAIFFCIMMFSYQLFMSVGYYLGQELKIYALAKTVMFIHYKSILYGIHLLIIGSITKWTIIDRIRIDINYYIRVFRIKLGAYFVGRTF